MKRVRSLADLQRSALAKGASVSVGSSRFNSGGAKMDAVRPRAPEPEPAAPPVPQVTAITPPAAAPAPVVVERTDTSRIEQLLENLITATPRNVRALKVIRVGGLIDEIQFIRE